MIYVIKLSGEGPNSRAEEYQFLTFPTLGHANAFIEKHTKKSSDGHKYWTRFDIVQPGDTFESF